MCSLRTKADGGVSLDFADMESSRCLAKAVFKTEYGLEVELPRGHLIPTIPIRVDYILWIEDLLRYAKDVLRGPVRGIDVGTGPSCVYPLLAATMHADWSFHATDVDAAAVQVAARNVAANGLAGRIAVIHNPDPGRVVTPGLAGRDEPFAFCMTNPPFYDGQADLDACRALKSNPPPRDPEYTASEYFYEGGELAFIRTMVEESLLCRERVVWYTSCVAKKANLKPIRRLVRSCSAIKTFHTTRFIQGTTSRWAVAWSFHAIPIDPADRAARRRPRQPADALMSIGLYAAGGGLQERLQADLAALGVSVEAEGAALLCRVAANTWCRRSRRGHPPPAAVFTFRMLLAGARVSFGLLAAEGGPDDFVSLVSHLQKKWALTKKKPGTHEGS